MINLNKTLRLTFIVTLCLLPSLKAQLQEEIVIRHFKVVAIGEPVRKVYFNSYDKDQEIISYPNRKSMRYSYKGLPQMTLYTLSTGLLGELVRDPVGSFTFRGNVQNWLIFMIKDAESGKYAIVGYPDEETAAAGGTFTFINLSSQPVIGVFGKEKIALKPGQKAILTKDELLKDHEESSSQIKFAFHNEQDWTTFLSSFWPVKDNKRSTIIIHNKPEQETLAVVRITETVAAN